MKIAYAQFARISGALLGLLLFSGAPRAAGLLTPSDASLPPLEIRDHEVHVVIEDGYAVTTVEQVFHNPHALDLEARYSFPVPEHGSVAEFTLWIDGKPVTGEVLERHEARRVYEEEKAAGREAGVTEKDAYRTFDIQVSPVRAGQDTRIRLVYLQPASVDTGIGRYVYPLEEGGVDEQKLAFWTANEAVTGRFRFDLQVKSAYPVDAVRVPNQGQARVVQQSPGDWTVHIGADSQVPVQPVLAPAGTAVAAGPVTGGEAVGQPGSAVYTLDTDIVVYWRHQAGLPGSVDLIANKPAGERRGTFMLVVTPGDDLQPITEGRDWIFVLDVSGSMQGKYATLADGVQRTLKKFRPNDRFRIVVFNTGAKELTSGFVNATPEMIRHYGEAVSQITPQNGTNLFEGLHRGLASLAADRTSAIILVTDGVANVGETRQRRFLELIRKKDVRLFTAIMGNSANRPLLDALTRASGGFGISVSNSDDIVGQVLAMSSKVTHEALHGVKLKIGGIRTADLTPQTPGSLYRGQQLVMFGHYWGEGPADITLEGRISGTEKTYRTQFDFPASANENPEIERLWAYARIEDLMAEMEDFGEEADRKQAVIDLATEYGLVTDYTSMVVVREEVFDARGIRRTNRDRLATEYAARQLRAQRPAVSRRADTQQPMYRSSRPGFGGGAFDPGSLLLLVALAWLAVRHRTRAESA